jgi:probable DNA repair protein
MNMAILRQNCLKFIFSLTAHKNFAYNINMSASMQNQQQTLTLCATARLSRGLQQHFQQQQTTPQWQTPHILTLQQWLADFTQRALLTGEVAADFFPLNVLNNFTEKMLWQQAIEGALAKHEFAELFDIASLAQSALEANALLIEWQIGDDALNDYFVSTETRQFLRWRNQFLGLCQQHQSVEPARLLRLQIAALQASKQALPSHIEFVGFDRIKPIEQSLINALQAKGVQISIKKVSEQNNTVSQIGLDDINAECRAVVAWAQDKLAQNPNANLGIFTPILGNIRRQLGDLLDDTFHPQTLHASQYETPRCYDFALGAALSEHAMIRAALNLLWFTTSRKSVTQATVSALLLDVFWSDLQEFDKRNLLDARMRKNLTRTFSVHQLLQLIEKFNADNHVPHLLAHIQLIQSVQKIWSKKLLPSAWAQHFSDLLQNLNWAQTRSLSSHEYQAKQSWLEVIASLNALDGLLGNVSATDAVQKLQQLCAAKMFQPESIGDTRIQILGMFEHTAAPLDAIWVLGMNDQHWPPPAKPNALLPSALQRQMQTPSANADAQAAFAQTVHTRVCNSAAEVTFSWSHKDGDRELRVSPLMADIPESNTKNLAQTMAESLSQPIAMQMLEDNIAPALKADEKIRGGSKLFEAQAICPAWTFYQYRLGAKKLEEPSEGLDNIVRGNLVHAVLQHFWLACKSLSTLKALSADALQAMIDVAIGQAIAQELNENLPAQIIQIERRRLQQLMQTWLALEMQRDDFTIFACEAQHTLNIEGLEIICRIDRIDAVNDGDLVIIDYKTGTTLPALKSWTEARISEPQLPLYASLALKGERVVAACFAKVHVEECKFSGVAEEAILPGVTAFTNLKSNSPFTQFEHMPALIAHWQDSLNKIAIEIKTGVAGVIFEDENDLMYCDVKPLLRLPERELQFEQQQNNSARPEPVKGQQI